MEQITRILVIRFSSIGDIVLTTPVVRALKTQLSGQVTIDYLCKKQYAAIVESNPHIDEVITIEKSVSEVADLLRNNSYDYVVDLHHNLRSQRGKQAAKSLSFTLDKRNIAKWLYVRSKRITKPIGHIVERSFNCIAPLGIKDDGKGLDYLIPDSAVVSLNSLPEGFRSGFVAYAIGGQTDGKILPEPKIKELLGMIEMPVILLGGPEDKERGDRLASEATIFNACGMFNLNQSASLVNQCLVLITHDTGLMHIGAALKKKVISLGFATTPELGMSPWLPGEGSEIIEAESKNRPTSKLGNKGYGQEVFNIDLERVASAVN